MYKVTKCCLLNTLAVHTKKRYILCRIIAKHTNSVHATTNSLTRKYESFARVQERGAEKAHPPACLHRTQLAASAKAFPQPPLASVVPVTSPTNISKFEANLAECFTLIHSKHGKDETVSLRNIGTILQAVPSARAQGNSIVITVTY